MPTKNSFMKAVYKGRILLEEAVFVTKSHPSWQQLLAMTAGDDQVDLVDEKCGARFVRCHQWMREDLNFITVKFQIYIKCVGLSGLIQVRVGQGWFKLVRVV